MPIIAGIFALMSNLTKQLITDYAVRLISQGVSSRAVIYDKVRTRFALSTGDNLQMYNLVADAARIRQGGMYMGLFRDDKDQGIKLFPQRFGPSDKAGTYEYTIIVTTTNSITGESRTHSEVITSAVRLSYDQIQEDYDRVKRQFQHSPSPPTTRQPGEPEPVYTSTIRILTAAQYRG